MNWMAYLMLFVLICQGYYLFLNTIIYIKIIMHAYIFIFSLFTLQFLCTYLLWLLVQCFMGFLSVQRSGSLCLYLFNFLYSWDVFLLFVLSYSDVLDFLSYNISFLFLRSLFVLQWEIERGWNWWGRSVEELEGH